MCKVYLWCHFYGFSSFLLEKNLPHNFATRKSVEGEKRKGSTQCDTIFQKKKCCFIFN